MNRPLTPRATPSSRISLQDSFKSCYLLNSNGRPPICYLNLDCRLAKLLDGSGAHGASVAHNARRLCVPLRMDPIDWVFQHCGCTVVVFRRDEYKSIRGRDLSRPFLHHLVLVRRSSRHSWGHGLIEERHRELSEVEEPSFNTFSLMQLLKNPLSQLFRKPALACAADDYGNCHIVLSLCHNRLILSADEAD